MAWVTGGKHFGQYTYEHWFDYNLKIEGETIMQKEVITLFARYNMSANGKMDSIIRTLSPAEWDKPLGGYFPSVRSLCSHLYICDFNWLKRFRGIRTFTVLGDPFFNGNYSFQETIFENMEDYFAKRPDMDRLICAFADELSDTDMEKEFSYTDSHGEVHQKKAGGFILQFLNHQTHHRGMISVYLEMLGKANDFSSLRQVL